MSARIIDITHILEQERQWNAQESVVRALFRAIQESEDLTSAEILVFPVSDIGQKPSDT